jgi:hypothetical protein
MENNSETRRDWNWDKDGALEGLYLETREVVVKEGPSAGKSKLIFDFHTGFEDETVSVWETAVILSEFTRELRARRKADFEPGERIVITPAGKATGQNGTYHKFEFEFEHAAPKPTAAELLAARSDELDVKSDIAADTSDFIAQGSAQDRDEFGF